MCSGRRNVYRPYSFVDLLASKDAASRLQTHTHARANIRSRLGLMFDVRRIDDQVLGACPHRVVPPMHRGAHTSGGSGLRAMDSWGCKGPRPHDDGRARFHKTTLCRFFASGRCMHGRRCSFAHGVQDLQPRPELFKTKFCMQFLASGVCFSGDGCRFRVSEFGVSQLLGIRWDREGDPTGVRQEGHLLTIPSTTPDAGTLLAGRSDLNLRIPRGSV